MGELGRGWYSRGYLPHIDTGEHTQFLTWRLADSLPASVIETWTDELHQLPENDRKREKYRRIESYIDAGHGSCLLKRPELAKVVEDSLLFGHDQSYDLSAWVIMPNHVHVLLRPLAEASLEQITRSIKSFTARQINALLGESGRLWQPDFFDRIIRDEDHFYKTKKYIEWNPVKAGLCTDPSHWRFSSFNR